MLSRSIRRRTLALVLGILAVSLGLMSWTSYTDARHEIEELFDARLAQSARLLQGLISRQMSAATRDDLQAALDSAVNYQRHAQPGSTPPGHHYESKLGFQVFDESGAVRLASASAPAEALEQLLARSPATSAANPFAWLAPGFHTISAGPHQWRLFLLHDEADQLWMLVSERDDVRGELVGNIARRNLLPDLVGVPLLAVLIWLAVGWGLRPLARMAQLLRARDPDNLSPLLLAPLPRELEPVAASLNRLLQQVNQLLEREKRFIADAAHELRTPLAVLRIHAQNAQQAGSAEEREQALAQLLGGVDRTTRVVSQLLTLARLEPNASALRMAPLDLHALACESLAELTPLALSRQQELTLEADEAADYRLTGDAASLATLLQNVVGNALQYTPDGGQIQVSLEASATRIRLLVADSGPGVAPELRPKLFERFYRQGGGQGAGLGLSIIARIAELHGAEVRLEDSPLGGLAVRIELPRERQGAAQPA